MFILQLDCSGIWEIWKSTPQTHCCTFPTFTMNYCCSAARSIDRLTGSTALSTLLVKGFTVKENSKTQVGGTLYININMHCRTRLPCRILPKTSYHLQYIRLYYSHRASWYCLFHRCTRRTHLGINVKDENLSIYQHTFLIPFFPLTDQYWGQSLHLLHSTDTCPQFQRYVSPSKNCKRRRSSMQT